MFVLGADCVAAGGTAQVYGALRLYYQRPKRKGLPHFSQGMCAIRINMRTE